MDDTNVVKSALALAAEELERATNAYAEAKKDAAGMSARIKSTRNALTEAEKKFKAATSKLKSSVRTVRKVAKKAGEAKPKAEKLPKADAPAKA